MVVFVLAAICCLAATASAKTVRYQGVRVNVPRSWPVYDLAQQPTACVRFNRHALYLGTPSVNQRCPAHSIGRTESILVEPRAAAVSANISESRDAQPSSGSLSQFARGRTLITASWRADKGIVERALGVRELKPQTVRSTSVATSAKAKSSASGGVFTGQGFDVCSAPSTSAMAAWHRTKYRAIGIYIGGANMGCSQPALSSAWVSQETSVGWHLIPTYVGLQAPSNSCGCASITPSRAASQGRAAARDAIQHAESVGLGSGNPIYFDMEAYSTGGQSTTVVLKFLSAWTRTLHAGGYLSGVYSSGASGVADLARHYGTSYHEPDDLWVADWNGRHTTSDPYVPSADWSSHQRIHQYSGGQDVTHGGYTLNIDGDTLDARVAGSFVAPAPNPSLTVRPLPDGSLRLHATWPGNGEISRWQVLAGESSDALSRIGVARGGSDTTIPVHSQFPYYAVRALDSSGNTLAVTDPIAARPHVAIFGRSAFVPAHGPGGIPVGCYIGTTCQLTTEVVSGGTVLGTARAVVVANESGQIVHFRLTSAARSLLVRSGGRLPVKVVVRDASGIKAVSTIKLLRFVTHGHAPARSLTQSSTLRFVGSTDFVHNASIGGILAGCFDAAPCRVRTEITSGATTIAEAGPQFLGAHELGYLMFHLTPQGKAMLANVHGNHLAVQVTLQDKTAVATGHLVLVSFST